MTKIISLIALSLLACSSIQAKFVPFQITRGGGVVDLPDTTYPNLSLGSEDMLRLQTDLEAVLPVPGMTLLATQGYPGDYCTDCGKRVSFAVEFKAQYNGLDIHSTRFRVSIELDAVTRIEGRLPIHPPVTVATYPSSEANKVVQYSSFYRFLPATRKLSTRATLAYYNPPDRTDGGTTALCVYFIQEADFPEDQYIVDSTTGEIVVILPTIISIAPISYDKWMETYWGQAYMVTSKKAFWLPEAGWISWVPATPTEKDAWLYSHTLNKWIYWNAAQHPFVYDADLGEWTTWQLLFGSDK